MPNWVTTEIKAPSEVIASMLDAEGRIDFNKVIPFEGEFPWNGISMDAETAAERALNLPLDEHPLVASLQDRNRSQADVRKLSDESFEQFVQMLRNHRKTGFMHGMDFARERWGTKWNACEQEVDVAAGTARMETAWSWPEKIIQAVSAQFPGATLLIRYADEDIGSNCGQVHYLNGQAIYRDEARRWADMDQAERKNWEAFAYQVKGWTPDKDDA
ncbi:Ferredoxin-like domain in Api92-like protein [compost metagenome]